MCLHKKKSHKECRYIVELLGSKVHLLRHLTSRSKSLERDNFDQEQQNLSRQIKWCLITFNID